MKPLNSESTVCDLPAALARLRGSRELLKEMIDIYLEDYQTLIERMEIAVEAGDPVSLSRNAHSLKGLAANFNADHVTAAADSVRKQLHTEIGELPTEEISALKEAAEELAEHLRDAFDDIDEF